LKTLRICFERLSFFLWMMETIIAISLAGIGIEGMLLAGYLLLIASPQPVHFPLSTMALGGLGMVLSRVWRQVGVEHFHYLQYDSALFLAETREAPSHVLDELIREVENSAGYARNDARAKAKAWLIEHVSSLDGEGILLAKAHFGYLLPAEWGHAKGESEK
jgi:hypothetical protein